MPEMRGFSLGKWRFFRNALVPFPKKKRGSFPIPENGDPTRHSGHHHTREVFGTCEQGRDLHGVLEFFGAVLQYIIYLFQVFEVGGLKYGEILVILIIFLVGAVSFCIRYQDIR